MDPEDVQRSGHPFIRYRGHLSPCLEMYNKSESITEGPLQTFSTSLSTGLWQDLLLLTLPLQPFEHHYDWTFLYSDVGRQIQATQQGARETVCPLLMQSEFRDI